MTTITTIGRITKDFELKTSEKSGCVYANFSIAVNEGFGDKQKTTYFECTVFGADAERLIKAKAKKGSLLHVTGKFGTSEFTRESDGSKGYSLRITVLAWSYVPVSNGQKNGDSTNGGTNGTDANSGVQNQSDQEQGEGFDGLMNLDDDDMPF